ncbi:MAG: hypothetical protein JKY46_01175 [Robiginitomaculum sp.]|nr:hypothetical protein [Robiginitomaculum sp.]
MKSNTTFYGHLSVLAKLIGWLTLRWPLIVLAFSVISPISPHIRLPYVLSYSNCSYIGTRGVAYKDNDKSCPLISMIDTRKGGGA